jgi:predicted protein tyrosine phosphatase
MKLPNKVMKVLCMCQGGNCRSVACAYVLKYGYGLDALACGWQGNKPETLQMLFEWADLILVMQSHFIQHVPEQFHSRVRSCDVGEDVWFHIKPDLIEKCKHLLKTIIVPTG